MNLHSYARYYPLIFHTKSAQRGQLDRKNPVTEFISGDIKILQYVDTELKIWLF
jgi:hypothetical protein